MTEYVYRLTTNVPVGTFTGAGGVPDVHHSTAGHGNITERGIIGRSTSVAVSASDGHTFELELLETREDIIATVDAFISELGIPLQPWQRSWMIAQLSAWRKR